MTHRDMTVQYVALHNEAESNNTGTEYEVLLADTGIVNVRVSPRQSSVLSRGPAPLLTLERFIQRVNVFNAEPGETSHGGLGVIASGPQSPQHSWEGHTIPFIFPLAIEQLGEKPHENIEYLSITNGANSFDYFTARQMKGCLTPQELHVRVETRHRLFDRIFDFVAESCSGSQILSPSGLGEFIRAYLPYQPPRKS